MNKVTQALPGFYAAAVSYLKDELPEIQQVEGIEEFEQINLVSAQTVGDIVAITYDVICPDLFPSVRARLMEKDFIKRHNVLHTGLTPAQDSNKEIKVTLGYYGSSLQICLECKKEAAADSE